MRLARAMKRKAEKSAATGRRRAAMTDYEIGIAVGVLIAWPMVSIGVAITMAVFTHPRGGDRHE